MGFCYRSITFQDLPEPIRTPLLLAVAELPDWETLPLMLLIEATPDNTTITKQSRVNGFCTLSEPYLIAVVVRQLSKTINTLYHEYEHYAVHRLALKKMGWDQITNGHIKFAESILEPDSDRAGEQGLKAFKSKYPDLFGEGEAYSIQWMKQNKFSDYNDNQNPNPADFLSELDECIATMKTINKS